MARRLPTIIMLALGTAAVLAGCQQEPPIKIEPTASPESQTPKPQKPELPAKAKRDDYVGAVAFVEHYYELAKYGEQTGNWKPIKKSSASNCHDCKRFWRSDSPRSLNYQTVTTNDPGINDLIDGIAQVNTTVEDRDRKTEDGNFPLSWIDIVKCTFKDGRWKVTSIESRAF